MYKTYMDYLAKAPEKLNKQRYKNLVTSKDIAKEFNVSRDTIKNYISLLKLPTELQDAIVLNHGNNKQGI